MSRVYNGKAKKKITYKPYTSFFTFNKSNYIKDEYPHSLDHFK